MNCPEEYPIPGTSFPNFQDNSLDKNEWAKVEAWDSLKLGNFLLYLPLYLLRPRRLSSRRERPEDISTRMRVPQQRLQLEKIGSFPRKNCSSANSSNLRSVQATNRVFSIASVLKFNKGKTWRIPGHPHIPQWTIFSKSTLDFVLGRRRTQIPHVNFALKIPLTVARHFLRLLAAWNIPKTGETCVKRQRDKIQRKRNSSKDAFGKWLRIKYGGDAQKYGTYFWIEFFTHSLYVSLEKFTANVQYENYTRD